MATDLKKIIKKLDKAKIEYDGFRAGRVDAYRYVVPGRNNWENITPGTRTDLPIYNSEPVAMVKKFAANIVNLMCPSGLKFFNLASSERLDDAAQNQFNQQMSTISNILFEYIEKSNFYIAMGEACLDLAVGTGAVLCKYSGNRSNPLSFTSLNISKLLFLEDANGLVNYVFQQVNDMDIETAQAMYPYAKLPIDQEKISFISAVVINELSHDKKFTYLLFNEETEDVYYEETVDNNPFAVFRWSKLAGESIGRGVIYDMLGLLKTANVMASDILIQSERVINPPTMVYENSIINPDIDFSPGAIVTVKPQVGVSNPIFSLPSGANLPFGMQNIDLLNAQLERALFIDVLGQVGKSQQTATEVTARLEMAANVLSSVYGRLQREALSPLINCSISILQKQGLIPKIGGGVHINYIAPIMYLQKQQEYQRLMQTIQSLAQIAGDQAQHVIASSIDIAQLPTYIAEHLGADLSLFRTPEQLKELMQQQLQASLQQQQMSTNQALAGAPINTGEPGVTRL